MITIKSGSGLTVLVAFKADDNTPATGLTPAITVYKASDNSKVDDAETMTEVGLGLYKYTVDTIVTNEAYGIYADGGATLDTYRYQYGAFYANAGNEDTVATVNTKIDTIDTNVDTIITELDELNTNLQSVGCGSGIAHTLAFSTTGGAPDVGLVVWLTTDAGGLNKWTSTNLRTNSGGRITFFIELNVTYYVWTANKSTYVSTFTRTSA